jgi:hypothetical protein
VTETFTTSRTNTFTDARLRAVMPEVGADFSAPAAAGIITFETARRWTEHLTFVLQRQAADGFQLQLTYPNGTRIALDYRVSSDGSVRESGTAGGVDYYALPAGTTAMLFVNLKYPLPADVRAYTSGWGAGSSVQGDAARDRVYSKDGYGIIRGKIGPWP